MRRFLLPLSVILATIAVLPRAAEAAVVSSVSSDTLTITGDGAADRLALRLAPGAPGTLQIDVDADGSADQAFDRATFTRISIRSGAGADDVRMDESNGAFTDAEATTIETGAGGDIVGGGRGAETIASGDDGDLVLAAGGDDTLFLGAGDDTALQGRDDGSDVFEGQSGGDMLQTAGSSESEEFAVQAFSGRALITRDVGSARADMAGIEFAEVHAGGGPDLVDVGNLAGTELARVDADLGLADGARDIVFAAGSAGSDTITASDAGDTVRVAGLPGEVRVDNASAADDRLTVQAGGGIDKLTAIGSVGNLISLTLEGNELQDQVTGGSGNETLRGGPDADILRGNQGNDVVEGGDGADHFVWNRMADGSDAIDGGAEQDRIRVPSSSADDSFEISSLLTHVRLKAELGVQSDLVGLEVIDLGAATGADRITVNDLTGTDTNAVVVDLGPADLKVDNVFLNGTPGPDTISAKATSFSHDVLGLPAKVFLTGAEPGDRLTINGRDGEDQIDASTMTKDKLQPFLDGGPAKDILVGSPGQDEITGGAGDDVAFMRDGLDTFKWQAGDGSDVVEGGAGDDFLRMNGSGANEAFAASPIGGRIRVTRDIANIVMDTGDVERFDIMPAGGADSMRVDDLSGTDAKVVSWELAPFRGTTASDGAKDSVLINGTFGNDAINVTAGGQQVRTSGLAAAVEVTRADNTIDTLHIDTRPGNDLVSVQPQVHNLIGFSSS
jgi:Ca2+-binding RTX toxin-like protein